MKIIVFALLSTFIFKDANAQITITSADMPVAANPYTLSTAKPTVSVDTTGGEDKTWDFSALSAVTQAGDTFFSKSSMPPAYQLYFFTSNLGEKAPDISLGSTFSLTNSYNIYKNSEGSFEQTAAAGELNGIAIPIYYTPSDVWYEFPLHFNDTSTSNSAYSVSLPSIGSFSQQRVRRNKVMGWGSLKLPMGAFNVLVVKTTIMDHDSLYIDLLNTGTANNLINYQYKFIGQTHGVPLLEIDVANVLGRQQVTSVIYQDTLAAVSGIPFNEPSVAFSSFPNPSATIVRVFTSHGRQIQITDVTGRTVFTSLLNSTEADIDVRSFSNGIYFVSISDNAGRIITKKLMVQH